MEEEIASLKQSNEEMREEMRALRSGFEEGLKKEMIRVMKEVVSTLS